MLPNDTSEKFYVVGTTAKISCFTGFETSFSSQRILTCGENAKWSPDSKDIVCRPICGKQASTDTAFITGGQETSIAYAPWHVGIYRIHDMNIKYKCGGSILTDRIIISAMHCFWNRRINAPFHPKQFKVAAGKQYHQYNSTIEPNEVQFFQIDHLHYQLDYKDVDGDFAFDIVMALLDKPIHFRYHIAPVCVVLNMGECDVSVDPGLNGSLAGWGFQLETGKISEALKIINMPTIDKNECINAAGYGFSDFITPDTFCAGYLNTNISTCQGHSGGGLVIPKMVNGAERYFLRGIVTVGPNFKPNCDASKYSTFTNVLYYNKFISKALLSFIKA